MHFTWGAGSRDSWSLNVGIRLGGPRYRPMSKNHSDIGDRASHRTTATKDVTRKCLPDSHGEVHLCSIPEQDACTFLLLAVACEYSAIAACAALRSRCVFMSAGH
ncbi:unnamed protein product [Rangifer tarandus platyrhynchus]|uniref:Uncharacterized protein n=1 Tax=Rangifer tarandus platyrhynchus TaxID=3082113 RepID=A0ABN8XMJ7_RANTA|nr:unnamed protein product [Rangifer tarandus platyrhynchus]